MKKLCTFFIFKMVDNNYFYTSHVVLREMNVNCVLEVKRNVLLQSFCFSSFLFLLPWLEKESSNKKKMITVLLSTSFQISFIIWCQRATRSLIQSSGFFLLYPYVFCSYLLVFVADSKEEEKFLAWKKRKEQTKHLPRLSILSFLERSEKSRFS